MRHSIKFSIALIFFSLCTVFNTSCKKSDLKIQEESDKHLRHNKFSSDLSSSKNFYPYEIENVIKDENFISFMKTIKEIASLNKSQNNKLSETQLQTINQKLTNLNSINTGITIFNEYNIPNSKKLFELFSQLSPKALKLINTNTTFNGLNKNEISILLMQSIWKYNNVNEFNYNSNSLGGDKCSTNYATGMASCDTNFTIATATSILAGVIIVFGTAGAGAVGGAVAVTGGIGAAYAGLIVCQEGVVDAWRDCRGYTFIKFDTYLNNMI